MAPMGGAPTARRDSGCAEQWESRDPLPLAPCHAGRRAHHGVAGTAILHFFPDHRLSNSGDIRVGTPGADLVSRAHRAPLVRRRTPHLPCGAGGACRTAPIRWSMAMRYGASPRNPDPAPLCPASSDRCPLVLHDAAPAVVCCSRSLGRAMHIARFEPATSIHVACMPVLTAS